MNIDEMRKQLIDNSEVCKCGKKLVLEYNPDEKVYTIGDIPVCRRCWCEALAKELAEHPIVAAHKMIQGNKLIVKPKFKAYLRCKKPSKRCFYCDFINQCRQLNYVKQAPHINEYGLEGNLVTCSCGKVFSGDDVEGKAKHEVTCNYAIRDREKGKHFERYEF